MKPVAHKIYVSTLSIIVVSVVVYLTVFGLSYYGTSIETRFFHDNHEILKPSGSFGHGYGIVGTLFMIIGISTYMARKRFKSLSRLGLLKHWLEFHIFLCLLGPILVLFHTSFKFGGLVALSFWSMVAVVLSGVIGRFIYIQIPRTIEGRELTLSEVSVMKNKFTDVLEDSTGNPLLLSELIKNSEPDSSNQEQKNLIARIFRRFIKDRALIRNLKKELRKKKLTAKQYRTTIGLLKNEISLNRRIDQLVTMQNLLKYWHVAHLPFAMSMLIIMLIHVAITVVFGYKWIF